MVDGPVAGVPCMTVILAPVGSPFTDCSVVSCCAASADALATRAAATTRTDSVRMALMCRRFDGAATLQHANGVRVERLRKEIALRQLASERQQLVALLSVLDTLGNSAET